MSGKLIIHVKNDSAGGRAVEMAQALMRRWHERGYGVAPVPADGHEDHPYGEPCWHCSDVRLEGTMSFPNTEGGYFEAEKSADGWAGDNGAYAAVVEDHDTGQLLVMDGHQAEAWQDSDEINADIIYRADHRPVKP